MVENVKIALVGVGKYTYGDYDDRPIVDSQLPALASTFNKVIPDAEVRQYPNPNSKSELKAELGDFWDEDPTDWIIFYYSGHGQKGIRKSTQLYLTLPNNKAKNIDDDGLTPQEIFSLAPRGAKLFFILDCCFSGSVKKKIDATHEELCIWHSCQMQQKSSAGKFTEAFRKKLEEGNSQSNAKKLTLQQIYDRVPHKIETDLGKHQEKGIFSTGEIKRLPLFLNLAPNVQKPEPFRFKKLDREEQMRQLNQLMGTNTLTKLAVLYTTQDDRPKSLVDRFVQRKKGDSKYREIFFSYKPGPGIKNPLEISLDTESDFETVHRNLPGELGCHNRKTLNNRIQSKQVVVLVFGMKQSSITDFKVVKEAIKANFGMPADKELWVFICVYARAYPKFLSFLHGWLSGRIGRKIRAIVEPEAKLSAKVIKVLDPVSRDDWTREFNNRDAPIDRFPCTMLEIENSYLKKYG